MHANFRDENYILAKKNHYQAQTGTLALPWTVVFCEPQASFSTVATAAPENCAAGLHDQSSPPN
jgi:hypothetical protein